jgi:transcriptional regulator with AAA-type ATPase domain/predicted ATPase
VDPLDQLLGVNPVFAALKARARQLLEATRRARRSPAVLLQGEVGTGKNLLARALHQASARAMRPFVHVQCNAIPDTLAEALLFGHERGAFTGADRPRAGYFRTAHEGTVLLDEIGTLSEATQARLLQVIDEGLVPVLGMPNPVAVDVWVICATNTNLDEAVRERRFRADLLSRLTVRFTLPPLRQRRADIVPLAEKFVTQACADFGLPLKRLSPAAQSGLERQPWPDNVRGLRNTIENAVIFASGTVIGTQDLGIDAAPSEDDVQERYVDVLEQTDWNISRAAQMLSVTRQTLRARIARWQLKKRATEREHGGSAWAVPAVPGASGPAHEADAQPDTSGPPGPGDGEPSGLDPSRPAQYVDSSEVRWERRWLGFLRFSLTGPDEDDTMVTASPYLQIALERVRQFGGHVVELWPTGMDAAFGLDAVAGSAQRAAFAALAIQVAVHRAHQDTTGAPEWRIALHATSCLVASHGSVPRIDRDARRRADERLEALVLASKQGGVLASNDIVPFLRRRFSMDAPLGPGHAAHARPLLGPLVQGRGFGEPPGKFVGRHVEIELLHTRAAMARQGSGQIVGMVGDPGIGKSRLVWEFAHGEPDRGWLVLETASIALGRPTPLLAAIELLRAYFDVGPGQAADVVRDRVVRRLTLLDGGLLSSLPVFLTLLDVPVDDAEWQTLDPDRRRRQMLSAITRLLLRESARQPLLLVFEDAHWADAETRELLDELAEAIPVAHVFLIVTYRPELEHGWGGRSFYTQLRVEPLRGAGVDDLLDALLGRDPSLATLRPRLVQWTDGNPFFIEEVVRTLEETAALVGERGAYRLARPVEALVVPRTVEEVLASRIARLGPGPAEVLRAAAVVGGHVPYTVLTAVWHGRAEALDAHLRVLQGGEFLYQAGEAGEREYTFRHALTQEVAYASLTDEERRVLHSRAMDALASVYASRENEKINELAHHAFECRVWDRAAGYLRRAGRRAFARSANREGVECFTRALTALSHLPQTRASQEEAIDLRLDLRNALWPIGEIESMAKLLDEAGDLAQALGDSRRRGLVAVARCHYGFLVGRHVEAVSAGDEALTLARAKGDRALQCEAMLYLGIVHGAMGNYARAVELLQATLEVYEHAGATLSARERVLNRPTARTYLARYLAELGELAQATRHAGADLEGAEGERSPFFLTTCYYGAGGVELRRGDFRAAISQLERALELCHTHYLRNWLPAIGASLGYAYANSGRAAEGVALLEGATAQADRMRLSASYSMWLTYLGHAYLALGRVADARRTGEAGLDHARRQNERGHEAWALYLLAAVVAATASATADEVETAFGRAIDEARALGMRPLLAHGHAALADALDRRGRPERASEERALAQNVGDEIGMVSPSTLLT